MDGDALTRHLVSKALARKGVEVNALRTVGGNAEEGLLGCTIDTSTREEMDEVRRGRLPEARTRVVDAVDKAGGGVGREGELLSGDQEARAGAMVMNSGLDGGEYDASGRVLGLGHVVDTPLLKESELGGRGREAGGEREDGGKRW